MRKTKILFIIISLFIVLVWIAYASYNLSWDTDNSDAGLSNNDNWDLTANYSYQNPNWNSVSSGTVVAMISWNIKTTLFWDFTFSGAEFIKWTSLCLTWTTYYLSWTISSLVAWWDMTFDSTKSYYCPYDWSWAWVVNSDRLWEKIISVASSTWELFLWASFNVEEKVLVKWLIWTNNSNIDTWIDVQNVQHWVRQYSKILQIDNQKAKLNLSLNKNIETLTKYLTPINDLLVWSYPNWIVSIWTWPKIQSLNNTSKDLYYFNYEWESELIASNENNKWKILTISKYSWNSNDFTDYQVWVLWYKTVIVKWANVYIDADIYNVDKNSLLVLIVKRDPTSPNNQNWGNVYINPNVTNIDAVIIADWSIINFDWSSVITSEDSLRNQLYIYGSTYTKNSIWANFSPYWSDGYIKNWDTSTGWEEKYDLTQLRYFNLIASSSSLLDCSNINNLLIPRASSSDMSPKLYAWAWKRKCFNEPEKTVLWPDINQDVVQTNLRWNKEFNPLIIEYNPIIQKNPPYILKDN